MRADTKETLIDFNTKIRISIPKRWILKLFYSDKYPTQKQIKKIVSQKELLQKIIFQLQHVVSLLEIIASRDIDNI